MFPAISSDSEIWELYDAMYRFVRDSTATAAPGGGARVEVTERLGVGTVEPAFGEREATT